MGKSISVLRLRSVPFVCDQIFLVLHHFKLECLAQHRYRSFYIALVQLKGYVFSASFCHCGKILLGTDRLQGENYFNFLYFPGFLIEVSLNMRQNMWLLQDGAPSIPEGTQGRFRTTLFQMNKLTQLVHLSGLFKQSCMSLVFKTPVDKR